MFYKSNEQIFTEAFQILQDEDLLYNHFINVERSSNTLLDLLNEQPNSENVEFWFHFTNFRFMAESIISQILKAALKRRKEGKPALNQQDYLEQISHLREHLNNWEDNNVGDLPNVVGQARHTACRALLGLYAYMLSEKPIESEDLILEADSVD